MNGVRVWRSVAVAGAALVTVGLQPAGRGEATDGGTAVIRSEESTASTPPISCRTSTRPGSAARWSSHVPTTTPTPSLALHLRSSRTRRSCSPPVTPSTRARRARSNGFSRGHTVYILGGTAAISPAVANALVALGYGVTRYGGADRFETATIIADQGLGNPSTILEAAGLDFPDAVIAGPPPIPRRRGRAAHSRHRHGPDHIRALAGPPQRHTDHDRRPGDGGRLHRPAGDRRTGKRRRPRPWSPSTTSRPRMPSASPPSTRTGLVGRWRLPRPVRR